MTRYEVYARSEEGPTRVALIAFVGDFNPDQARAWAEQIRDVFHDHYRLHSIRCTNPAGELPCQDQAMRQVVLSVFRAAREAQRGSH